MVQINTIENWVNGKPSAHKAVLIDSQLLIFSDGFCNEALDELVSSLEDYYGTKAVGHIVVSDDKWEWDAIVAGLDDEGKLTNPTHSEPMRCPKCNSDNLETGSINRDTGEAWAIAKCLACEFEWDECFTFSHWESKGVSDVA